LQICLGHGGIFLPRAGDYKGLEAV
jgi:hypothetical protein